jgi:hypothetical protein
MRVAVEEDLQVLIQLVEQQDQAAVEEEQTMQLLMQQMELTTLEVEVEADQLLQYQVEKVVQE